MSATGVSRLAEGTQIDHFRIVRILGKGGMGAVYLAEDEDENLGRQVAVKVLSPTLLETEGYRDRFYREARSAARLNHPNIVSVYHLGEWHGSPYFAMEYVHGKALDQVIADEGAMTPARAIDTLLQVLEGMKHALSGGVIHRDLKPANLFLGGDGRVRVLDFGLARAEDSKSLTATGAVMGTPDFMAPEQGLGKKVGMTADVYAVGVILFQFLSGQLPFHGDSALEVMMSHVQRPPPPLGQLMPHLPKGLVGIVARCLQKDPTARYQGYEELIGDLRSARGEVEGMPVKAPVGDLREWVPAQVSAGSETVPSDDALALMRGSDTAVVAPQVPASSPQPREDDDVPLVAAPSGPVTGPRPELGAAFGPYPIQFLGRFYRNPIRARRELLVGEPEWADLGRVWLQMGALVFVPGAILRGYHMLPVIFFFGFGSALMGAFTFMLSKLFGRELTLRQCCWLWMWACSPGALAGIPVVGEIAGLFLGLPQFFIHFWFVLTKRSEDEGEPLPQGDPAKPLPAGKVDREAATEVQPGEP
jgi:predicted Ser/Thr protein kinase